VNVRTRTVKYRQLAIAIALDSRPQYMIAAEAGIPPQHLGGFQSGRMEPSAKHKSELARVLNVDAAELFGE
jgi:hypothetical protein